MKKKYFVYLIYAISIIIFGGIIFFASQLSAVFPPIKEYQFEIPASQLKIEIIKSLENQDRIEYKFTDTVGNGHYAAYYLDLRIRDNSMNNYYTFKYYEKKSLFSKTIKSKIDLISAFDSINKTGGYKLKDDGVARLISIFEKEFIEKLKTDNKKK